MKKMTPKQAVIYVRVSTDKQADVGMSLDNQERACNEWALRNGILALRLFREEGASAKSLNRPKLKEMMAYIEDHHSEIDYVVIYQIDRLSRSMPDFVDFMRFLDRYKISLRDSNSHLEASESDELIQGMQALLAQHDNKLKSRRVRENMQRHASQGYRMHQAPYGLRNVRDESGKSTVAPAPKIADKITLILTEFAKGTYTGREILHECWRIDLTQPNGKPMNYKYLGKMLRQPLYAGLEKSSLTEGQYIQSLFAGIVPEWVFYTNQQLIEGRKRVKSEGYNTISEEYILRRFASCAECGKPLRGSAPAGRGGKRYPRYHCTTQGCTSGFIKPEELHARFIELLKAVKPSQDTLGLIATIIVRVWRDEVKSMRTRRNRLTARLDALKEEKINASEKVVTGELSSDEKNALVNRLDEQARRLRKEFTDIENRIGHKEEAIEYSLNSMSNAPQMWLDASPDGKHRLQYMIFPVGLQYDLKTSSFGITKMSAFYTLANIKKDLSKADKSLLVIPRGVEPLLSG